MKREGRQHGVVSCYQIFPNLSSQQRYAKMVDSASTMRGLFAKVATKPTNQSKYTGKCQKPRCNRCRVHPVCKSKDKAKGTMKNNYRTIDVENELSKYSFGTSATRVLAYLVDDDGAYGNDHDYDYDYDHDYDYQDRVEENYDHTYDYEYTHDHDHDSSTNDVDRRAGLEIEIEMDGSLEADEDENDVADDHSETDDSETDDDDAMSFCDVGLCWGHEEGEEYGDDGWYLVGGQMQ